MAVRVATWREDAVIVGRDTHRGNGDTEESQPFQAFGLIDFLFLVHYLNCLNWKENWTGQEEMGKRQREISD